MRKFTFFLLGLISAALIASCFTSCTFDESLEYNVPSELEWVVDDFIADGLERGVDRSNIKTRLTIEYIEGQLWVDGVRCKAYCSTPGNQIVIRMEKEYAQYNLHWHPTRLKGLIYHELGHGALSRGHNDEKSIMGWASERCDAENQMWGELVDELFQNI